MVMRPNILGCALLLLKVHIAINFLGLLLKALLDSETGKMSELIATSMVVVLYGFLFSSVSIVLLVVGYILRSRSTNTNLFAWSCIISALLSSTFFLWLLLHDFGGAVGALLLPPLFQVASFLACLIVGAISSAMLNSTRSTGR